MMHSVGLYYLRSSDLSISNVKYATTGTSVIPRKKLLEIALNVRPPKIPEKIENPILRLCSLRVPLFLIMTTSVMKRARAKKEIRKMRK